MDAYDPDADLRLDEKRLAAELGVSRTPVREALSRLEHQGLVTILPAAASTWRARARPRSSR